MDWRGYYINLERATARREAMEQRLESLGLTGRYGRFPAVDGRSLPPAPPLTPGEAGIYMSHMALLRIAGESPGLTHIVEDDTLISRGCAPFISALARRGRDSGFDVLVTDTGFSASLRQYEVLREAERQNGHERHSHVALIDFTKFYCWSLTSYIVSPEGAKKFLEVAEAGWNGDAREPIDIVLARAAGSGRMRIGCTFPFLTWLNLSHAAETQSGRAEGYPAFQRLSHLARYPFYVDRDMLGFFLPEMGKLITRTLEQGPGQADPRNPHVVEIARRILRDSGADAGAAPAETP